MTDFKVNGLVIREVDYGDNDKLLTVLTEKHGKLYVIGKGVRSLKNRHMACAQLITYASFNLRRRGNFYYITDSDLIENYYDIRNDIVKVSLSAYICDVLCEVGREEVEEKDILKLALNTFYAIAKDIRPLEFIRAAFQLRIATECGFMPDLSGCIMCNNTAPTLAHIDIMNGNYVCDECRGSASFTVVKDSFYETGVEKPISIVSDAVLQAMRYICGCKQERFLSFSIEESEYNMLYQVCEKYLLNQLERGFFSLDFYKSLI